MANSSLVKRLGGRPLGRSFILPSMNFEGRLDLRALRRRGENDTLVLTLFRGVVCLDEDLSGQFDFRLRLSSWESSSRSVSVLSVAWFPKSTFKDSSMWSNERF